MIKLYSNLKLTISNNFFLFRCSWRRFASLYLIEYSSIRLKCNYYSLSKNEVWRVFGRKYFKPAIVSDGQDIRFQFKKLSPEELFSKIMINLKSDKVVCVLFCNYLSKSKQFSMHTLAIIVSSIYRFLLKLFLIWFSKSASDIM